MLTFTGADIATVLSEPGVARVPVFVVVIPAGLLAGLVNIGALLRVDNLVYLGVSVLKLDVISTELPTIRRSSTQ